MSWSNFSGTIQYGAVTGAASQPQFTLSWWDYWNIADISQPNWAVHMEGPLGLFQYSGDESLMVVSAPGDNAVAPTGTFPSNGWHQFVAVFDGTQGTNNDRVKLYADGVFVATTSSSTFGTAISGTPTNFAIKGGAGEARRFAEIGMWNGVALGTTVIGHLAAGYKPSLVTPAANHYISLSNSGNANAEVGGLTTTSNAGTYNASHPTMQTGSPSGGGGSYRSVSVGWF